jgi:hypothetical protein
MIFRLFLFERSNVIKLYEFLLFFSFLQFLLFSQEFHNNLNTFQNIFLEMPHKVSRKNSEIN